jgi:hypothetical protein
MSDNQQIFCWKDYLCHILFLLDVIVIGRLKLFKYKKTQSDILCFWIFPYDKFIDSWWTFSTRTEYRKNNESCNKEEKKVINAFGTVELISNPSSSVRSAFFQRSPRPGYILLYMYRISTLSPSLCLMCAMG